jgi:membrane-associated protease RseP (regulator of RpoE activity)
MNDVAPPRKTPTLNIVLFFLTVASVTIFSGGFFGDAERPVDFASGFVFAVLMLSILLCHEMGHFVLGRIHQMLISLPYFIPVPLGFGTLGAIIFIRSRFPNRNALVDVGAAGPLAGATVAVATHVYGVANASLIAVPPAADHFNSSALALISRLAQSWAGGSAAAATPQASFVIRDSILTKLIIALVRGGIPEGHDLLLSPSLLASSAVLIITMLNLFPVGQLDGGHVAYALFGQRHPLVGRVALLVMIGLGVFCWVGWWVWALIAGLLVRVHHPPVIDDRVPMTPARMMICLLCLALFVLTFTPAPIELITT